MPSFGTLDPDCLSNSITMTDKWLTLSGATKLLGVHRNTVRLWSDKGMLPVYKTQGGHRRYVREEILLWARSNSKSTAEAYEPETMLREVLKNIRMQISEGRLEAESWYQKLDIEARNQYRLSARSFLQELLNYISTNGEDASMDVYAIGYEYASRARRYSLTYGDAVRAFHFFRSALIESVACVYDQANVHAKHATETYTKIDAFMAEILINLREVYRKLEKANR